MAACNTQSCEACIDGAWGQWGQWSKCTASCDSGFRVRHRDAIQRPNSCGKPAIGLEDEYQVCEGLGPCTRTRTACWRSGASGPTAPAAATA